MGLILLWSWFPISWNKTMEKSKENALRISILFHNVLLKIHWEKRIFKALLPRFCSKWLQKEVMFYGFLKWQENFPKLWLWLSTLPKLTEKMFYLVAEVLTKLSLNTIQNVQHLATMKTNLLRWWSCLSKLLTMSRERISQWSKSLSSITAVLVTKSAFSNLSSWILWQTSYVKVLVTQRLPIYL